MRPERWQQIDKLLKEVLECPLERRAAFLDAACVGDKSLREEVEALLSAHGHREGVLDLTALEVVARGIAAAKVDSLVGRRLGPYQIVSFLGAGGMGEVYRARDTCLERLCALKILPTEVAVDSERLHRFQREAKAASALNHPNIATIYEIGESEGIHWIAMELVEGETLSERIAVGADPRVRPRESAHRDAPLPIHLILDIGIQVADALDRAHSKGIIHHDIKPANIMLTAEGQVKVLDFGLAKRRHQPTPTTGTAATTESQTTPGLIMGTVEYMSPEQVLGQEVDQRTDLFSLGVVLYNVVTGRLPFSGASSTETMDRILHSVPDPMARFNYGVLPELERIVRKCLEKDRDVRCQTASELRADLRRLKRDTEEGKAVTEVSKSKPRRLWLWAAAILLMGVAAAAGFWFIQKRNEIPVAPLVPVPFITLPGLQEWPNFSPDGKQVAFAWNGEKQDNWDIYIKQIGSETPRRLTTGPYDDEFPAWSPDGLSIAFMRNLGPGKDAVMLIPSNGGRERQVAEFQAIGGRGICWHPGGKWLAVCIAKGGVLTGSDGSRRAILLIPQSGNQADKDK